jgi:hypothetical protein
MDFIIVCGNDDCRQEYGAQTDSRQWECPKCGRVKSNDFWPFLDARLMQARIDKDTDWRKMHDQLLSRARQLIEDKDTEISLLKKDLEQLKRQLEAERSGP